MTKKLLTLCFLLSLHFINCSDCSDKAILNEGEDIEICYSLNADPIELACVYDSTTEGCVEKQCSELDPSNCGAARPFTDENNIYKNCMAKSDKSGCDYYSCEDLETKCNSFHEYDSMNEKCVSKTDNSGCELKRCTDLTSECSSFSPRDPRYKCVSGNSGCEIIKKECQEFDPKDCDDYVYEEG